MATNEIIKECPRCGKMLVIRKNAFWGCKGFPNCRYTENLVFEKEEIVLNTVSFEDFVPSIYQERIREFFASTKENIFVEAIAGSGKTMTTLWLMSGIKESSIYLAFSSGIAKETRTKLAEKDSAQTLHSICFDIIKQNLGKKFIYVDKEKKRHRDLVFNMIGKEQMYLLPSIFAFVSAWKNTFPVNRLMQEQIDFLIDRFTIDTMRRENQIVACANAIIDDTLSNFKSMTFDDMPFLVVYFGWTLKNPLPIVFVDEFQDLSSIQIDALLQLKAERFVFVGDKNQSIMAFRGADYYAIQKIKSAFNCVSMPLSISYRNPKAVCRLVKEELPSITHLPAENAIEGSVNSVELAQMLFQLRDDNDMVICRNNWPLLDVAKTLSNMGKKFVLSGFNLEEKLISLISQGNTWVLSELIEFLEEKRDSTKNPDVDDNCQSLLKLAEQCQTVRELIDSVRELFSENNTKNAIKLMTIHKAKGLEAQNVYFFAPELLPHPKAITNEQKEQEVNLFYVAITRPTENLYFVKGN